MREDLKKVFQYEVLKMLKKEGKIKDVVIENMLSWRHSGFHVYIGDRIFSDDQAGLGNLARYIIVPVFLKSAWSIYRHKIPMTVPPRSYTHRKTGSRGRRLMPWTGWPGW